MTPDRWQRRKVRDFGARSKIINIEGTDLPPLSITKGRGVILQSEKYKKQIATDITKYVIARRGQFAFDPMSLYYGAIGWITPEIGLVSPDYVVFDVDGSVDKIFMNYVFRWPEQVPLYEAVAETGNQFGKRRRVYWSVFEELEFLLPPLKEQRKIATILSAVDETIEGTQAVIDQLQVVRKAMMAELLTRGLPGRHTRLKQTEIGNIPEGWSITTLASVCYEKGLQTGPFGSQLKASEYTPSGIPVVMPKDIINQKISDESIARISEVRAQSLSQHRVEPGDVLFGRRGDIGRCALVRNRERGWICGTGCLRARPRPGIDPEFLVRWLGFTPVVAWLTEHAVGQTMLNLNTETLSKTPVAVPPLEEQSKIAKAICSLEDQIKATRTKLEGLTTVKSALMSALLSGELRVTPDEATP